jgi:uncharacterized protein (TIGR02270 family)
MTIHRPPATLPHVIRRHAEDAAFYWARRMDAAHDSRHDLRSFRRFEQLLLAHLEGLRVAERESAVEPGLSGDAGWAPAWARAQMWKTADEAFVAGVLALEEAHAAGHAAPAAGSKLAQLEALLHRQAGSTGEDREVARGLTSAAAWLPWEQVMPAVYRWAHEDRLALRRCALATCALQRIPAGEALALWLQDPAPLMQARALRAVGELGRDDLSAAVMEALHAAPEESAVAEEAAAALCLLGDPDTPAAEAGIAALARWPGRQPLLRDRTLAAWAQAAPPPLQQRSVRAALQERALWRPALTVMRFSAQVEWLLLLLQLMEHQMESGELQRFFDEPAANLARQAADVFAHIAGLRIGEGLWQPAPEPEEDAPDPASDPAIPVARKQDPDDGLLWPDVPALKRWWSANDARFVGSGPMLAGRALTVSQAREVLVDPLATQSQRRHAALFLRAHGHTPQLFDVAAPLQRQRAQAAALGLVLG